MNSQQEQPSNIGKIIRFCLENKLIVGLLVTFVLVWGVMVAPFEWHLPGLPRSPVPTDAIPDIGENQQVVFTEWPGRSPQDVEDQVTFPLTVALLGVPEVRTVRSFSYFGFSTIYVIFTEDAEFYWTRTRILEKLGSLPLGTLPADAQPALGPDATALGQIFWYTLEGLDEDGTPTGGWDLDELRTYQDWYVRYALLSAGGVSDVASIGGFVREYQVDVDPDAMRANYVTLEQIYTAISKSNIDVGARSIEVNKLEYFIRGLGFIRNLEDLNNTMVAVNDNTPILLRDVANVTLGPALRLGALEKNGEEAVGGIVVMRYQENPLAVIRNVKDRIDQLAPAAPRKAVIDFNSVTTDEIERFAEQHGFEAFEQGELHQSAWTDWLLATQPQDRPEWVALSQIRVVPYYDRTGLILETLNTLNVALYLQVLVTVIVILVMIRHLKSSLMISAILPLAVLLCFIAMRTFGVDANIVALSGIAIAIGTIVDVGIILTENIFTHLGEAAREEDRLEVVYRAAREVGGAVMTAISTTIISFLPVFTMQDAEGKLFRPLAFTKTFVLIASLVVGLTIIPSLAHWLFTRQPLKPVPRLLSYAIIAAVGVVLSVFVAWWLGAIVTGVAVYRVLASLLPSKAFSRYKDAEGLVLAVIVALVLSAYWLPLGTERGIVRNVVFVVLILGLFLSFYHLFYRAYEPILKWCLEHKKLFVSLPLILMMMGLLSWQGFERLFWWLPRSLLESKPALTMTEVFPGLGREFMPPLDEGSFLYMPTLMPHAGIGESLDVMREQNDRIRLIYETDEVVGKLGRADTPIDPAPVTMIETLIHYRSEYLEEHGRRMTFRFDASEADYFRDVAGKPVPAPDGRPYKVQGKFERDDDGRLIPDTRGNVFRIWRPPLETRLNPGRTPWTGIRSPDDIWDRIAQVAATPGIATPSKLQPIITRVVMLQTGMRTPMGIKIQGPDLETIEAVGIQMESLIRELPYVDPASVVSERILSKPYLEIDFDRIELARYGLSIQEAQEVVEVAIGGKTLTRTVEGRERYPVRARYLRELRDSIEALDNIYLSSRDGAYIPISQVAEVRHATGPMMIRSEDTFLTGYLMFDRSPQYAEVEVVEAIDNHLRMLIDEGRLHIPPEVTYSFAGTYEAQVRATERLRVVLPLSLFLIFLILYLQFRAVSTTLLIFSGIAVAWAGGFLLLWLYSKPWFLDVAIFGVDMRELFQIHPINLSVAVWVGFLALFGIATDDGVVMTTYLDESFRRRKTNSVDEIRQATIVAGKRRVRPALMTTATTVLALLPVITSTGRGADIMVPMAIPSVGGMIIEVLTMLIVPVLYCAVQESKLKRQKVI